MKTVTLNDILLFHKKITKNEYNKHTNDVGVVAITSNLEDKEFGVLIKKEDLTEGELKVDSQDIIIKRFGKGK
ncbi:MAG: hypothetical protein CVU87_07815 [Firmicutes bacterium HGW-Firmicutes-12]|jgi:mRNA-degrading endonuclease toxin of MazEF toxin-antitoxin module|nr:MAG: hypothetical protein CVU87_07815 [Firmicutes bacterium HGW-Firmicutes-12]